MFFVLLCFVLFCFSQSHPLQKQKENTLVGEKHSSGAEILQLKRGKSLLQIR